MGKTVIHLVAMIAVLAVGTGVQAEVFIDDFNTPHDYVKNGATGTIWDDYYGWMAGETVTALNAAGDREGQLFISSEGSYWDTPWSPLGPFLYKIVKGDFIATVKVTDYAGTAAAPVYHNDGGLMARAFPEDAGTGEDWISIDYFPIWNCGNFLWQADDNVRNEAKGCNNGKRWNLDPWLQLERAGSVFHVRTSKDGVTWTEMSCSPKTRNDLAGIPLQVGLRHATYSTASGYVAFDDFRLEVIIKYKAYNPTPADKAANVTVSKLTWKPGDYAARHDVYLGTSLADVNNATTATAGIYKGRQDPNSFTVADLTPGVTYYWRIDEVNETHPDKVWKGDVWSFTPISMVAWNPSPADDAECVLTSASLTWSAGATAFLHEVYLGTDEAAVGAATSTNAMGTTYKKQVTTTYKPSALAANTTYFWRVDEADKSNVKYKGAVWSFKTLGDIAITDTHLVGWWKLDGGCTNNDIVVDSSGYNRHGKLKGTPTWIAGYDGSALTFNGRDTYVELPIGDLIGSLSSSSFMTWADFSNSGGAWQRIFDFGNDPNVHMFLTPRKFFIDPMRFAITKTGTGYEIAADGDCTDYTAALPSGWHHVAVTLDATSHVTILYLDGAEVARNVTNALLPKDLGKTTNNWLGRSQSADDAYYLGALDDFRIYDFVLSTGEVTRAMAGDPRLAWNPSPAHNTTRDVERISSFLWSPGLGATKHDVYLGTDVNAVTGATVADTTGIYRGRQDANSYTPLDAFAKGQAYCWRIDEVRDDGTITKGRIWTINVADFLSVDDFEGYNDQCGAIFYTWLDGYGHEANKDCGIAARKGNGTGATVGNLAAPFAERTIVHAGAQSMPMAYDNSSTMHYSEVNLQWTTSQDWTRHGVTVLTLWFRGLAANTAAPLYVVVQDGSSARKVVTHTNAAAVQTTTWTQWNIPISTFKDAGLNPTSIMKLGIGVGDPTVPVAGPTGTIYIDDIQLR